ncbi:MAG: carbon-nitrogen hydrolase family protein [Chitinophagales bacterium]|nr:carbon-nitrogen hydrolase family protein [Chitinophagales bacterium]
MKKQVRLALAQYPITAHPNIEAWQAYTRSRVAEAARNGASLLLFPEYGSMELVSLLAPEMQQDLHVQVRALAVFQEVFEAQWAALSAEYQVLIVAPSFPVLQNERIVNRAAVFSPRKGLAGWQDKFFMTRFEAEDWIVEAPETPVLSLFQAEWGSFGIQICYDVEFPLGAQALAQSGADLILAPSCTETLRGATRVHIGARARALEQQCFVGVAQTVGEAPWSLAVDLNYGYAGVYGPPDKGFPEEGIIALSEHNVAGWTYADLDFALVEAVRREGQVLNFRDASRLEIFMKSKGFEIQTIIL